MSDFVYVAEEWPTSWMEDVSTSPEPVQASGEQHERRDNWRDDIDLATCDRMTAYAAGRLDGHQHAMTEFAALWELLLAVDETWTPAQLREALEKPTATVTNFAAPRNRATSAVAA